MIRARLLRAPPPTILVGYVVCKRGSSEDVGVLALERVRSWKGRKGREGKGREGKGREGKGSHRANGRGKLHFNALALRVGAACVLVEWHAPSIPGASRIEQRQQGYHLEWTPMDEACQQRP